MRKSLIAQSVAVLIGGLVVAGAANAAVVAPASGTLVNGLAAATNLVVNTDGTGHINLVPYYSVQSGNDTYISVVNTDTRNGKAVKVRFRGASNSDDVFDITVLMSPGDHWSAAISRDAATGLAKLATSDKTCTLPASVSQTFVTARLDSTLDAAGKANQTREGYVEILNMADIPPGSALFTAVKHVNGVAPCTGTTLNTLFTDSTSYADAQSKGLEVPTTGLMTNWTIINVPRASSYSGAAVALEARAGGAAGYGNIVLFPQASTPVALADARLYTTDPLLAPVTGSSAPVAAAQYDFPDLSTPYTVRGSGSITARQQAQELTSTLAVTSVTNEFVTEPGVLGKTDWVFSMPTRRYSVAFDYTAGARVFADISLASDPTAVPPVVSTDRDYFTTGNTSVASRQICVSGITTAGVAATSEGPNRNGAVTVDREEGFLSSPTQFVVSPGEPTAPLTFCGEVSVLSFNNSGASVLGASVARKDLALTYTNGWMRISTPGLAAPSDTSASGTAGLPIIGAAMMELFNANATAGTAGGYGLTFPHRVTRVSP